MKYRSKFIIEAFQYDGDLKGSDGKYYVPDWAVKAFESGRLYYSSEDCQSPPCTLYLSVQYGAYKVDVGSYVVKDEFGKLFVLSPEAFEQQYEPVEEK